MLNNIKGFHIEPTNICTLKCPRCPRTKFIDQFKMKNWGNSQLNLVDFKNFFDIKLDGLSFALCGNYGDPIYYDNLIPMVQWLKSKNARVTITTNGSYRKLDWWQELGDQLTEEDTVKFSIDGSPKNFTEYRVNANWESIKIGIDVVVKSKAKTVWKYIPFSFNVDSIKDTELLSKSLGITSFELSPSDRWDGENDPLKPAEFTGARESSIVQWRNKHSSELIDPKCTKNHYEHFISATGYYMPCCYLGDHRFYYKSKFYNNKEHYNISNTTITQVLEQTQNFYKTIEDKKYNYCTFNCPKL